MSGEVHSYADSTTIAPTATKPPVSGVSFLVFLVIGFAATLALIIGALLVVIWFRYIFPARRSSLEVTSSVAMEPQHTEEPKPSPSKKLFLVVSPDGAPTMAVQEDSTLTADTDIGKPRKLVFNITVDCAAPPASPPPQQTVVISAADMGFKAADTGDKASPASLVAARWWQQQQPWPACPLQSTHPGIATTSMLSPVPAKSSLPGQGGRGDHAAQSTPFTRSPSPEWQSFLAASGGVQPCTVSAAWPQAANGDGQSQQLQDAHSSLSYATKPQQLRRERCELPSPGVTWPIAAELRPVRLNLSAPSCSTAAQHSTPCSQHASPHSTTHPARQHSDNTQAQPDEPSGSGDVSITIQMPQPLLQCPRLHLILQQPLPAAAGKPSS